MLRKNENIIRSLYNYIFNLKITNDYQENAIINLSTKEREYELLKEKTGAFYSNGKFIFNSRKDNEIMILRTENSNLKSVLEKKEKDIKNKDIEIIHLKEQLLLINKHKKNIEKKRHKNKSLPNISDLKYSYSNININFNEITHSGILKNYTTNNSKSKYDNKSLSGINDKTIYIPPQLRNDLSSKDFYNRKNLDNTCKQKKLKNKNITKLKDNYNKINLLSNGEKYISVNKSNYNALSSKKHQKLFSHTISNDISLSNFRTPSDENKKTQKIINLKSYNEKTLCAKTKSNTINRYMNKFEHSKSIKKVYFHSSNTSPISKYSKNHLKKNKLFLK